MTHRWGRRGAITSPLTAKPAAHGWRVEGDRRRPSRSFVSSARRRASGPRRLPGSAGRCRARRSSAAERIFIRPRSRPNCSAIRRWRKPRSSVCPIRTGGDRRRRRPRRAGRRATGGGRAQGSCPRLARSAEGTFDLVPGGGAAADRFRQGPEIRAQGFVLVR